MERDENGRCLGEMTGLADTELQAAIGDLQRRRVELRKIGGCHKVERLSRIDDALRACRNDLAEMIAATTLREVVLETISNETAGYVAEREAEYAAAEERRREAQIAKDAERRREREAQQAADDAMWADAIDEAISAASIADDPFAEECAAWPRDSCLAGLWMHVALTGEQRDEKRVSR